MQIYKDQKLFFKSAIAFLAPLCSLVEMFSSLMDICLDIHNVTILLMEVMMNINQQTIHLG